MSLSLDGNFLAIGGPGDNNGIGATWTFVYNGSTYQQLGRKLVGLGSQCIKSADQSWTGMSQFLLCYMRDGWRLSSSSVAREGNHMYDEHDTQIYRPVILLSGWSTSLSSDGRVLAVGGPLDNNGKGATWIFISDGSTYQQLGNKLLGNDALGPDPSQGKERAPATCM